MHPLPPSVDMVFAGIYYYSLIFTTFSAIYPYSSIHQKDMHTLRIRRFWQIGGSNRGWRGGLHANWRFRRFFPWSSIEHGKELVSVKTGRYMGCIRSKMVFFPVFYLENLFFCCFLTLKPVFLLFFSVFCLFFRRPNTSFSPLF